MKECANVAQKRKPWTGNVGEVLFLLLTLSIKEEIKEEINVLPP